jgi:hypothetical protein
MCRGTGYVSVEWNRIRGVVRCECLTDDTRIPARYAHCELDGFGLTDKWRNESLEKAKMIVERYARE